MRKLCCLITLAAVLGLSLADTGWSAEKRTSATTARIDDFTLRDHLGREFSLADYQNSPLVVVAFVGTQCPLAKLYGPRLTALEQQYGPRGVTFLAINSNSQDTPTEIGAYARSHDLTFPVLKDLGSRVADQFGAERTPEVFVLDAERRVRYHGRIDDQYGIGYQRAEPQRRDLAEALDELLAGRPVSLPETEAVGCFIGREPAKAPTGDITYSKHIAPIFNRRCVECHRDGEIAPFPLTSYDEVQGWGETIVEVISEQRMPPWPANPKYGHFSNDARLSPEEQELIFSWVENGQPEGDPADLPEPPAFVQGWRIAEPDQVFYMSDEAFDVPAEGVVDYQHFTMDPGFTEDKYVVAAEARPGNVEVVHHILVYVLRPGQKRFRETGAVDGYAPGNPPTVLPPGAAIKVPAGSKFVFELHYTPNGTAQGDRSYVGLRYADKEQVQKLVEGEAAVNHRFKIPPRASNHEVTAEHTIAKDSLLLAMMPHMHLRGKAFRYEAIYPDGNREILLDVPRYDFNWQLRYELAEPKHLPKGTRIFCTAHYDNSEANLANPDPSKEVGWGPQSWHEMMIGFFDLLPAN